MAREMKKAIAMNYSVPFHLTMAASAVFLFSVAAAEECFRADAIVSANGEGNYKTIQEAIDKAPETSTADKRWTILVKPGTYNERILVQRERRFVRLIGEDPKTTVVTYGLFASMKGADGQEIGTFRTPTVMIEADDFTIEKLTLENSAGPVGQALALRVDGDRVVVRDCRINGHQDTILISRGRQYFENCTISGTVDFIFGGATAWFDDCTLDCLQDGYITAASTPAEAPFGFVFSDCTIAASPGVRIYLGRPWRPYASTIFLRTTMPEGVRPEGWHNWDQLEREQSARYSEFGSTGPGANPGSRVKWARPLDAKQVEEMTLSKVLGGWVPEK
jgi:pectinesterase